MLVNEYASFDTSISFHFKRKVIEHFTMLIYDLYEEKKTSNTNLRWRISMLALTLTYLSKPLNIKNTQQEERP